LERMHELWPKPVMDSYGTVSVWGSCQLLVTIFSELPALAKDRGKTLATLTIDDIVLSMKETAEKLTKDPR
jgi:hypothetical protein